MVNFNGVVLDDEAVFLNEKNRGLRYGDAVFETLRAHAGKVLFWEDHYLRLMASMRILRMEIPMEFTMEFLEAKILETLEKNRVHQKTARIRLTVFRKNGGLYTPKDRGVDYIIETSELENPFYLIDRERSYEVELFKDHYIAPGLLSTIKSNNRAVNVLAGIYAEENEYDNCLLLNTEKKVAEALNGNLFLVKGGTIKTPPLSDGALNGILRKKLIDIIGKTEDLTLEEASISPFELQKADELFITNVISGIIPVRKYRKKEYEIEVSKMLLGRLNAQVRLLG
ncbi:aminotransferase class IV [Robertkochia marina]|uniref:branched-chain-amino-acid transaminase n=1 Tax=Robertkochia marina TaxID=1227945 RepID=A0A4S3LZW6_9FLAO|nr:aminotransferase class IV [Robertkochia marina]THD66855.1 aminotransferase class IV [Robertkochia marina]TRZ45515.1 aminotransferase class IV [Robertkochia marina]